MQAVAQYRRYSEVIKSEIHRTGNIYLFPDLKIPRTTAQYWLKKQSSSVSTNVVEIEAVYKKKSEFLSHELTKEKAMRVLLESVRRLFPYDFRSKHLKSKQTRAQIISAIQDCTKIHTLAHCLEVIGLPNSTYRRWASEKKACEKTKSPCERKKASQLTNTEIAIMKKFVTSKKYAHISVTSLHLLAQRNGELFCSLDTWYKYISFHDWRRPWKKEKREIPKTGIRALRRNEIWHLDVTRVGIGPGRTVYIQAIIDNFSRFVLAWHVTDHISAENTIVTLKLAQEKAHQLLGDDQAPNVMMDPGTENKNAKVSQFITSKNLLRTLARVDIHYSNSMVERLFYSLKNQFLYHQDIKSLDDLKRKASFYFRQHNEVVPLAVHKGGRPLEIFQGKWNESEKAEVEANKNWAVAFRRQENKTPSCGLCPI